MLKEKVRLRAATAKTCPQCNQDFSVESDHVLCPNDNTPLVTSGIKSLIGTKIGNFEIKSKIGQGSTGHVYLAENGGIKAAIKILKCNLVSDTVALKRFQQESETVKNIDHPNVAKVFECGLLNDEQPYIIMEFVEGETLADYLKTKGTLNNEEALDAFTQIADALGSAHAQGVIHRDLKPGNIMRERSGTIKIVDFGLAKMIALDEKETVTRTSATTGTPAYMSPEQCLGKQIDQRSDIYSFGCLMYECLSGKRVFESENSFSCMHKHTTENAIPIAQLAASVPRALADSVMICLNKDPRDRFQSARELIETITGKPTRRRFRKAKERAKKKKANTKLRLAMVGTAVVLTVFACLKPKETPQAQNPASNLTQLFVPEPSPRANPAYMNLTFDGIMPLERSVEYGKQVVGTFTVQGPVSGTLHPVDCNAYQGVRIPKSNNWYMPDKWSVGGITRANLKAHQTGKLAQPADALEPLGIAYDTKRDRLLIEMHKLTNLNYAVAIFALDKPDAISLNKDQHTVTNAEWKLLRGEEQETFSRKGLAYSPDDDCLYTIGVTETSEHTTASDTTTRLVKMDASGKVLQTMRLNLGANAAKYYWATAMVQMVAKGSNLVITITDYGSSDSYQADTFVINKDSAKVLYAPEPHIY